MPHFTFTRGREGYELNVLIGVSEAARHALLAAGQPVPPSVLARAMLDTGADRTAVSSSILRQLGVQSYVRARSQTIGGPVPLGMYVVSLRIPAPTAAPTPVLDRPMWVVTDLPVAPTGIDVLLGVDLTDECLLVFDGPARRFTLGF